jgi:hypothetical protein
MSDVSPSVTLNTESKSPEEVKTKPVHKWIATFLAFFIVFFLGLLVAFVVAQLKK